MDHNVHGLTVGHCVDLSGVLGVRLHFFADSSGAGCSMLECVCRIMKSKLSS